jgi:hypothetical protein
MHGSKLERSSSKFTQPGDFFTYIVFVCLVILVGAPLFCQFLFLAPHIICPHSALPPTIAVPGDEEYYPCTLAGPSFAINPKGQFAVQAWGEVPLRKLVSILLLHSGGCDSLHFIHSAYYLARGSKELNSSNQGIGFERIYHGRCDFHLCACSSTCLYIHSR